MIPINKIKKSVFTTALLMTCISSVVFGQTVTDIKPNDPAHSSISKAIKSGYFSLYQDQTFRGEQAVSRREMAVLLERLKADFDKSGLSISSVEIQELRNLSKSFKQYLQDHDSSKSKTVGNLTNLTDEQKVLHHDLSRIAEEVEKSALKEDLRLMKKDLETQQFYTWIAIGGAALFGMLF